MPVENAEIAERFGQLRARVPATGEERLKLADAEQVARRLVQYLPSLEGVRRVEVAGSFRRRRETAGDLDVLVSAPRGIDVMGRAAAGSSPPTS